MMGISSWIDWMPFSFFIISSYKIAPRFYMTSAAGGLEKRNSYTIKLLYCGKGNVEENRGTLTRR
jgi:hypothetical protein